ncbi:evr1_Alr domain-containing protein Alr [Rhynchophorus ferrugineus]|uniref:Sulfhydryl oxidase n=1 Tax=Rhynchophorus ferrugineus TaxID=354439 RepID=A0A834I0G6_RHYFE|nr:hypothetical protein GWI33_016289 [Rhynchophorus ferrugineus]
MNRRPTPLDNEQCRQCSSFSDYIKSTKKKKDENNNIKSGGDSKATNQDDSETLKARRTDCPLDKDELGNKSWGLLHTMAAKYPEKPTQCDMTDMKTFFNIFSKFYPCQHCAEDLREELKIDPPQVDSQEALSQWLCRLHNKVNVKIGKSIFDCSKVNERWRDGWLDGSCDY